ncbi:MAG: NADH-quinone oxidoreductase subunit M [Chitinivibrionales bacterium]|nr:NADH-quinone oxidoreductase subunit M [Chitinivibrionales bacterium]
MGNLPILSILTFAPLAGFALVMLMPGNAARLHRTLTLVLSIAVFALSLVMLAAFAPVAGYQFVEHLPLLKKWGISYFVGMDGISLFLVLLVTFLTPIVVLCSYKSITRATREYYALLLLLECGMIGTLVAIDAMLFYVFWEVMLIPLFFIIGIWGGPRRVYATIKFVLFTLAGSLLLLVGIIYVAWRASSDGMTSFSITDMQHVALSLREQCWLFGAFALAFAIKVPMFPLHTWLPDAHTEAPTGGSVILAGVLLKMGVYGFLRFIFPLFPAAAHLFAPLMIALSIVGIVYGALVAFVQDDLKKLVAYSSVSHLGYVMLGLFVFSVQGITGGIYQMLNHGLSTGALFLVVGMLYERRHTRLFADYGGLAKSVPLLAVVLMIATLSSAGLPGLNGFVGEFLILLAAFAASPWYAAGAATGVVLGAVYLLHMYQKVMFGPITHEENKTIKDLTPREALIMAPIIALMVFMGLFPNPILRRIEPSVNASCAALRATAIAPVKAMPAQAKHAKVEVALHVE